MAGVGNEWINGYLEAILDSGVSASTLEGHPKATADMVREKEHTHFNPTKYFVEEVVTGVDETDLHRTWIKVVATRNSRERSSRLENMCWRIWHLTRKKKQVLFYRLVAFVLGFFIGYILLQAISKIFKRFVELCYALYS